MKRYVVRALENMQQQNPLSKFIKIENDENIKGVTPIVSFTIQSDPIPEVGINGLQVEDMIQFCKNLVYVLNETVPCDENKETIEYLNKAELSQIKRKTDRLKRNVEGTLNK